MNIGPKESRKRLILGVVMLAVGIGIGTALIFTDLNRWWRTILFFPLWLAALGFFQAKEKT